MENNLAKLNISWQGQMGDMEIEFDSSQEQIKLYAAEAIRTGGVPGINADPNVDFKNFVVEYFPKSAADNRPENVVMLRPKIPFGV